MIRKIVGWFLVVLFSLVAFIFIRSGAYKSVQIEMVPVPSLQLFYTEHIGPYHEIVDKLKMVEDEFKKLKHPCKKTFGLFLSDPKIIEHSKLVSHVGCAFDPENSIQVFTLPEGIQETSLTETLTGGICYKGTFSGSPALSAMKVYPKLTEAAEKDGVKLSTKSFEVYSFQGDEVTTEIYLCED